MPVRNRTWYFIYLLAVLAVIKTASHHLLCPAIDQHIRDVDSDKVDGERLKQSVVWILDGAQAFGTWAPKVTREISSRFPGRYPSLEEHVKKCNEFLTGPDFSGVGLRIVRELEEMQEYQPSLWLDLPLCEVGPRAATALKQRRVKRNMLPAVMMNVLAKAEIVCGPVQGALKAHIGDEGAYTGDIVFDETSPRHVLQE